MKKHLISFHVYRKLQLHSADFEAYLTPSTSLKLISILIFYVFSRLFLLRSLSTATDDTKKRIKRKNCEKYDSKNTFKGRPCSMVFSFNSLSSLFRLILDPSHVPRIIPIGTEIHMLCWDLNWTAIRCRCWTWLTVEASTDTRCMSRRIQIPGT